MGGDVDILQVVVPAAPDVARTKGPLNEAARAVLNVDVERLRDSLADEIGKLRKVFSGVADVTDGFAVDEVSLALEISAEGGFRLLGSATVGAGATITVTLKRQPSG